jgi:hypothetical protein
MAASPTQILAENAQRPPAEWMPDYLRALAKMEQLAYYKRERAKMETFVALMDRFELGISSYFRDPEMASIPPEVEAMRLQLLNMCEDMHLDDAAFKCDCNFCTDATAISFRDRVLHPSAAHNLRTVAATLCRPS